jgi:tetratricopeptide (TPR) repeat protein
LPTGFLSVVFAALQSAAPCSLEQATALLESRRSDEIRAVLETCADRAAGDARLAEALGRLALSQGDSARAVKLFERAAAVEPQNSELQLWLGRAYGDKAIKASVFEQPGLAGRVRKSFEKAVALDPGNLEARSAMLQYYLRAPRVLGGSPEKAREQARAIRDRDPLKGYRAWGRIAEHEKRFVEAGQEYDRAREEFPDRAEPYYWRAALAASLKDYARAFDVLESLLRAKPSELPACYEIGRIAAASGDRLDRGEECLKLYLEGRPGPEDPSLAQAHLSLGTLYEKRKNRAQARDEYREALHIDPGLTEARAALARISR